MQHLSELNTTFVSNQKKHPPPDCMIKHTQMSSLILSEVRQTSESPFDDATEAFVPDDLVEAITNRRKSDVDVDIRSHFRLHLSA